MSKILTTLASTCNCFSILHSEVLMLPFTGTEACAMCHHLPEMHTNKWHWKCGTHSSTPDLLWDAWELQLWRLLQEGSNCMGMGAGNKSMYSSFILHGARSHYWWIISCSSEKFTICLRITKEMPFILICFSNIRVVLSIVRHELVLTCSSFTWKDNTSIFTINDCVYKTWPGDQCWCISVWFRSVLMICMLSFTFLVTKKIFYPYVFSSFYFTSSWVYLVRILFI